MGCHPSRGIQVESGLLFTQHAIACCLRACTRLSLSAGGGEKTVRHPAPLNSLAGFIYEKTTLPDQTVTSFAVRAKIDSNRRLNKTSKENTLSEIF